ncbi:anaphase-promoting complex, cyclosome, subunit 4-domain-containing protein [Phascolomyces articulosus]|uniref:Anaphase-promoting complex subunit 4 n=1 Tax=Phascolomyces articulosus TaxID=60185 RepID=A0AAD5KCL1_9FUNG|nr:anaphase-promoting complex, cyclosome, subunit 4-domain-containing protein [Phascolomyces articulosus]
MPQVELLGLISTGNTSEPVHAYFTQYLTDQQVKRWESRSSQSYGSLQKIINEYLEPACSRLLHRLNRLRGYSLWNERYSELIDTNVIESCIDTAQLLLKRLVFYRISIDKVCLEFREFIKWVLHSESFPSLFVFPLLGSLFNLWIFCSNLVVEKLAEQNGGEYQNHPDAVAYDPWLVVSYIKTSFATDGLAEYFTVYPGIERTGNERGKCGINVISRSEWYTLTCKSM